MLGNVFNVLRSKHRSQLQHHDIHISNLASYIMQCCFIPIEMVKQSEMRLIPELGGRNT